MTACCPGAASRPPLPRPLRTLSSAEAPPHYRTSLLLPAAVCYWPRTVGKRQYCLAADAGRTEVQRARLQISRVERALPHRVHPGTLAQANLPTRSRISARTLHSTVLHRPQRAGETRPLRCPLESFLSLPGGRSASLLRNRLGVLPGWETQVRQSRPRRGRAAACESNRGPASWSRSACRKRRPAGVGGPAGRPPALRWWIRLTFLTMHRVQAAEGIDNQLRPLRPPGERQQDTTTPGLASPGTKCQQRILRESARARARQIGLGSQRRTGRSTPPARPTIQ